MTTTSGSDVVSTVRSPATTTLLNGALRQGLTLVPIPAQLEVTLPLSAQLQLNLSSIQPKPTRGCVPKVLKLSSNVSDVFPKVLKSSSEVSECKPLPCVAPARPPARRARRTAAPWHRGLHSYTFQLNLSRFGHTFPCPLV